MPSFFRRLLVAFLVLGVIAYCFSQDKQLYDPLAERRSFHRAQQQFQQAEKLYETAGDDETQVQQANKRYRDALQLFETIAQRSQDAGDDSLVFQSLDRAALISFYMDETAKAKSYWIRSFALKKRLPGLPDTLMFLPHIYLGGIYYSQNQFDSALLTYNNAESIQDKQTKPLFGLERLYNRLGAMYYEMGDYRVARNYFEKAIANAGNSDPGLLANYKINIASILVKLQDFEEAKNIYESLVPLSIYTNEINHNLGIISLRKNEFSKALEYFRRINYSDNRNNSELYYNFAIAFDGLHMADSSENYYQKALQENARWSQDRKNTTQGLLFKFRGEQLARKNALLPALEHYQLAIRQFDPGFDNADIFLDPTQFTGVYSFINLFQSLTGKAEVLEKMYGEKKELRYLEAALRSYESAFLLADHVERSYDSDEARLFLNRIKHDAHNRPIEICLNLYERHTDERYLEKAYYFDQRNKASVLSLNISESQWLKTGSDGNWNKKDSILRNSITRLTLKSSGIANPTELKAIQASIRDAEIELMKNRDEWRKERGNKNIDFADRIPSVAMVQKKLDPQTALLSYHLSPSHVLALIITKKEISYRSIPAGPDFTKLIDSLKSELSVGQDEHKYSGHSYAMKLYDILINPIHKEIAGSKRLVIIPDDELNYLPFESLVGPSGYLINDYSVQYQFMSGLLGENKRNYLTTGTLAFAPFASGSSPNPDSTGYSQLPFSKAEVSDLHGEILVDSAATKSRFLSGINHYPVLHLATHAKVDNQHPEASYIAFYPSQEEHKLFATEIYNLDLDSTALIILSACETGTGKLVKGEGLMSLSRAFAYAGCPNIVTSLWKAEDRSTSILAKRFHYYLEKGVTTDMALQKAKIDLLEDPSIDPHLKMPNAWAHLVFIGEYEPSGKRQSLFLWLLGGTVILLSASLLLLKRRRSGSRK